MADDKRSDYIFASGCVSITMKIDLTQSGQFSKLVSHPVAQLPLLDAFDG
jgi:hypothetical protein